MATDIDEIVSGIVKEKSYSGNSDIQEIVSDMSKERDQSVSIVPSSVKVIPPNEAAKVLDLSGRFGIRSDIVARNLETLQTEKDNESAREFSLNYQYTPKTAEWLGENPYNAALTLDDIHGLMNIEKDIQDHGMIHNMIKGFGTTGMLQVANMALRAPGGAIDATLGAMRVPGTTGSEALKTFESITGVKAQAPRFLLDNPATRWVDEMAAKTSPPEMSGDFWNEVKSGNLSRAGRILAVQAATNAPMSVALLAASVFGGPAGAGAGLATMGAGEAGTTSLEARNKGVSTEKGQIAALLHGAVEVGGEYIGTILPFKQWGKAITRTYGKEVTKKVFSDMFKTIAYTHGEEGLGEGATKVVQDLTDYFSGINPNALDGIVGRTINASAVGFVSGPVTSAMSLGSTIRQNIIDQKTAVLHKDFMTALGNSVESSKVKERLPEKMREVVERMTKDGPVENVYIDPGVVDEYFQGEKSDPIQFMQSIGALESYTDAKEHGGKIKIPLSVWAEKIIGTKAHIDLLNDTSFSPDTPSFNEAQETAKRLAKAEQEASSESGAFDDIRQDIISKLNNVGGFSPQEISAQADMMAKRVIRRASILDVDPVKLWNSRHFDIERSIFPAQNNVVSPPAMPTTQEIEERANLLMGIDKEQNQLNTEANRRWNDLLKGGIKEPPGMREEWLTLPLRRRNKNGEGLDIIKDKAIELGLMGPNDDIIEKIRSLKSTKKEKGIESYLSAAQSELVAEYEAFGHPSDRTPNTPIISLSEEAPFQGPVQGDLFGDSVGKVNPVVRYEDLYSTARKNGMDHPQARKYALDEMGKSIKKPSTSISNVQGEFGSTGGISGFGSGRRGENDLFQDQTSPQSQENQTPIETAALSDLVARSQVLFPSLHSSYTEIIWKDPDFVKLTNDAISVIDKYLKDSTGSNGKTESIRVQSYLHDVMHRFAGAAKEKNSSLIEELTKQFPDLQNEFSAVYMANSSMAYPKDKWFDKYISNKWVDKLRPKVGIENDLKRTNDRSLYQSGKPQAETPAFRKWFGDSVVTDNGKPMSEGGKPLVVYHGSQRADRIGDRFKKNRATSGPMQYFTDDPELGSKYSEGKKDTSLETPDDYAGWFKYKEKGNRKPVDIDKAWFSLSLEQRDEITKKIYTVGYQNTDTGEGQIVGDSKSIMPDDSIAYQLREAHGNALRALVEIWLNSGSLYDQEDVFMDVLSAAGIDTSKVSFESPWATRSGVFPVYLSIQNPLNTSEISPAVVDALEVASKGKRAKKPAGANSDFWDKNTISGKDWMAELKKDIDNGTTYAWTRVPDWVTQTLVDMGFDGIKDIGGKGGGKAHNVWVPFEPTQIKSAIGNTGTFDPNNPSILYQAGQTTKPAFYSQLERVVEDKLPAKAPVSQVRNILNDQAIKRDEVEWSNVENFLAGKETVSKAELLDFLRENQVQVKDVVKGSTDLTHERLGWIKRGNVYRPSFEFGHKIGQIEHNQTDGDYTYTTPNGTTEDFSSLGSAKSAALEYARSIGFDDTKFSKYTLPGGENYREILLTIPDQVEMRGAKVAEKIRQLEAERAKINPTSTYDTASFDRIRAINQQIQNLEKTGLIQNGESGTFKSPHFSEPNILAHVRMNDRTTADGKRVLFLEEVQSDWHQKGREVGYKSNTAIDTKGWTAKKSEKSGWSVYDNNGNFVNGGITANSEKEAIQIIVSENLHIGLDKFKEDSAVPNAPFKKTWHELALKKVLRMAVEGGYDSISWTTGEQQAERYDLSKQVEALSYKKNDDGTFDVKAYRSGELPGINVGENITPNKLPDVVGKDVAAKMDQGTGKASRLEPWINLTGVDLKVGGEGMKGFYDKIIPDFLNKYTKKWGGRVQDALIRDYKKMEPGTWVVSDSRGNFAYGATTEAKAIAYAKREGIEGYTVHQVDANTAGLKIHALEITPTMREGIMAGQPLFQRGGNIPRARMVETSTRTLIQLFQNADLSSLIHELGHVYLKEMISDFQELTSRDAGTLNENQRQYIKDVETTLKYLGADSLSSLTTEQHELWARSFEAYLREGSAPSPELKAAFSRFRNWLIDVYRDIKGYLRGELNSEVRGVFDRLLASQEEITQADQTSGFETIFKSFEEAGMPESEAKNYARMVYDAKQAAEEDHLAKVMDQIKRENNKDWKDKRSVVESEITEKVNNIKTYVALSIMQNGTMPNGDEAPDGMKGVKLSKDALVQEFGESVLDRLPRPYIYSRVGGISAGDAAALFGYSDGTAFINDLAGAMPRREMIKQWTDSEMQARYGDKRTPEEKMEDAISSLHNDKRAQLLREELNYMVSDNFATFKKLVRRINKRVPTVEEVRSQAEKTITAKKVSEIKPSTYSSAESKAGREAVSLMLKGDIQGAFDKKMTELYNHELFRAAKNAKDNVNKIVNAVGRFDRLDVRKQIGKASQDILGMIDGLMERYDFRKGTTLKEIEKRKQLLVWVEEQKSKQIPITIPDYILDESRRVSYKDVAYQELLDVYKTIKILNHQAMVMTELLKSQDGRSFSEVKGELISTAVANFDVQKKMAPLETGVLDDTKEWVKNAMASHMKVETILEELDGDKPLGAFYKRIFSPLISARDAEWQKMEKTNNALRDIWSAYTKEERALWHYRRLDIPGTDLKMTKPTILSFALNVGNDYNAGALLEGLKAHQNPDWTNEKIMAVLNTLDQRDISVINRIWELIDSFWPEAKALEERVVGVAPEKVKAKSVNLNNGVLVGGYYPIKFNAKHDWRVWAWEEERNIKAMASPPTARAMTAHGSMIERKGTGGRLLRTDLSVISEHLQDVIHDITHREAVLDVNKIIQDDDVRNVIINSIGREKYNQLGPWIKSIAGERSQGDLAWLERLASRARSGMTTVALGFKVSSGLMQLNGYSNTVKMIGEKYAYRGLQKIGQNGFDLKGLWEKISSESNDMKYRLSTFDRDVRDNLKKSNIIAKRKGVFSVSDVYMAEIEKYYFSIIGLNDLAISVPTYLGAKEKAMDGNVKGIKAGDEKAAIAYAEKIVRTTQSANSVMDLAAVQRGGELQKLFTMFYSQMNIQFNQWMRVAQNVKRTGNFKEIFAAVFYLAFIPAVCKDIIYGGDEDKEWWKRIGKGMVTEPLESVIILRDIVGFSEKRDYEMSPAAKAGAYYFQAAKSAYERAFGDKEELTRKDIRNMIDAIGVTIPFPTGQVWKSAEYFLDWMAGNEEPGNAAEGLWRTLVTGKRK